MFTLILHRPQDKVAMVLQVAVARLLVLQVAVARLLVLQVVVARLLALRVAVAWRVLLQVVFRLLVLGFEFEFNWLFNVTINDISVIYVTAHRCAGGLKKKLDLRSGSQRHRHFVGFFNVPVLAPTRDQPFYTVIPTHRPI